MTIADVVKILDGKLMAGDGTSPRAVGAVAHASKGGFPWILP